jgi:hypothetical protein
MVPLGGRGSGPPWLGHEEPRSLAIRFGNQTGGTEETVTNRLDQRPSSRALEKKAWTVKTIRMGLRLQRSDPTYPRGKRPSALGASNEPIFSAASRSDSSTK